jgi:hypothetical protein
MIVSALFGGMSVLGVTVLGVTIAIIGRIGKVSPICFFRFVNIWKFYANLGKISKMGIIFAPKRQYTTTQNKSNEATMFDLGRQSNRG